MNIRQLQYFIAVADALSFSQAAKQVYVTPPALSQQIAALEKQLEVSLFIRSKHSIKLTVIGAVMLKEARAIIARVEEARQVVKQATAYNGGNLNIVVSGTFYTKFLPEMLRHFSSTGANINIDISKLDWTGLIRLLEHEKPDIVFTLAYGLQNFPSLTYKTLYTDKLVLVVHCDHPLAKQSSISVSNLSSLPLLATKFSKHSEDFCLTSNLCRKHGHIPNLIGYYPNFDSLLFAVESNKGVTICGRSGIEAAAYKNLHCIDIESPETNLDLVVAWQKDTSNPFVPLFLGQLDIVVH